MTTEAEQVEKSKEAKRRSALVRQSSALMPYRTPEELAEMVGRMKFMIPGGDKLTDNEIWGLSQAALIHGLNPLMKEIFWIDGPSPGIPGLRRKGKEQLMGIYGENGKPNLEFRVMTNKEKRVELEIPEDALAFECHGSVPAKKQAHAELSRTYAKAGAPWEDIKDLIGPSPVTVGYGYITQEEMYEKDHPEWWHECTNESRNTQKRKIWKGGSQNWAQVFVLRDRVCPDCAAPSWKDASSYSHVQHAQKRSEAHFWKIECDLPFDISPSGEGLADLGNWDDVIEGSFTEVGEASFMGHTVPSSIKTPEEFKNWQKGILDLEENKDGNGKATDGADTLFGEGGGDNLRDNEKKRKRPDMPEKNKPSYWPDDVIEAILEKNLADTNFEAAGMLAHSAFDKNVRKTPALTYARAYRAARDEGDDSKTAGEKGMAKYLSGLKSKKKGS
jgi:hypothetical protein